MESNKNRRLKIVSVLTLSIVVGFWLVSRYPALSSKAAMSGTETFEDPLSHQAHFPVPSKGSLAERVLYTTLNWYETNWRGMAFGLALAGCFLTLLSYLPKRVSNRRFRNSFFGMFLGTPLGVCVNCVAPIARGLYEGGSRMETALAVMFSSPTLNIVVLTMLFSIFPFHMALLKLLGTFFLVLLIVPLISEKKTGKEEVCTVDHTQAFSSKFETWPEAIRKVLRDYSRNLWYILARTGPLMLLAGFLGALLSHLWKFELLIGLPVSLKSLILVSFMGTFLPLPIAFDLMLTQALMMSGMSEGFVMALLFTLGTFSVYSAMIVFRTFSLKLAIKLYLIVTVLGVGLGYSADAWSNYSYVKWLERYEAFLTEIPVSGSSANTASEKGQKKFFTTQRRNSLPFWTKGDLFIESVPHLERKRIGEKPFHKISGLDMGITYSNLLSPEIFFDPLFFGRGIAAGDLNGDGWTDLALATDNGFELYQNIDGGKFEKIHIADPGLKGKQGVNIAIVDLNNDGLLDVFYTIFNGGNFVQIASPKGPSSGKTIKIPGGEALLTAANAFGDWNRDGFLDIVNGNYYLGVLTRTPVQQAANQLVVNRNMEFTIETLQGVPGQTHTVLASDWNGNGFPDLMIGNDYRVADSYYLGKGNGRFRKVLKSDGIISVTTQNTMSMDAADFNNDLRLDLYLANIGLTRGIDVVSNIFGETMKGIGRTFCKSGYSVLDLASCQKVLALTTLLNPEKLNMEERCQILKEKRDIRGCMVTRLAMFAAKRNKPELCGKINKKKSLTRQWCESYFQAKRIKVETDHEIPMKTFSNILYRGNSRGEFEDVSEKAGVLMGEWSWNAKFADLDNDEWQDIYVVNGVLVTQDFTSNNFFHNQSGKNFIKAEVAFGLDDYDHASSYVYLDIDNDGDLDIVSNTLYGPYKIYVNNESKRNSISFKLRDESGNRFCVTCRIEIYYGDKGKLKQMREIKASGGFRSFDPPVAHFGLDLKKGIDRVKIAWSDGGISVIDHFFPANREYRIIRRMGTKKKERAS